VIEQEPGRQGRSDRRKKELCQTVRQLVYGLTPPYALRLGVTALHKMHPPTQWKAGVVYQRSSRRSSSTHLRSILQSIQVTSTQQHAAKTLQDVLLFDVVDCNHA
jgi:hypothetical protein